MKYLLIITSMILMASIVLAQDTTDAVVIAGTGIMPFIAALSGFLLVIIKPLVGVLAALLLIKLTQKIGIQKSEIIENLIQNKINDGINYAEQWARKETNKPTSNSKLLKATEVTLTLLSQLGITAILSSELTKKIEATLEKKK